MALLRGLLVFASLVVLALSVWNRDQAAGYAREIRALRRPAESTGRVLLDGLVRAYQDEWVPVVTTGFRGRAVVRREWTELSRLDGLEQVAPIEQVPFVLFVGNEGLRVVGNISSIEHCTDLRTPVVGGVRHEMVLALGARPLVVGYLGTIDGARALVSDISIDCRGSDAVIDELERTKQRWTLALSAASAVLLGVVVGTLLRRKRVSAQ